MTSNEYQLAEIPLRFSDLQKIPELIKLEQIAMVSDQTDHMFKQILYIATFRPKGPSYSLEKISA